MSEDRPIDVLHVIMRQLDILEVVARTALPSEEHDDRLLRAAQKKIENIIHIHTDGSPTVSANDVFITERSEVIVQGDSFSNIGAGATIINRSNLLNSVNFVRGHAGGETAAALEDLAKVIEDSGSQEAVENFDALTQELLNPQPRKSLLKSYWTGIVTALPQVVELVTLGEKISEIIT
jgi:hypothetical protein